MFLLLNDDCLIIEICDNCETVENGILTDKNGIKSIYSSDLQIVSVANVPGNVLPQKHKYINDQYLKNPLYEATIDLDGIKSNKIEEFRGECGRSILSGFVSNAKNNESKHYDCAMTDQSMVNGLLNIAQLRLMNLTDEVIKWKATGELECYEFEPQEILKLGLDMKRHIESNTDKFNELRKQILASQDIDEINNIVW